MTEKMRRERRERRMNRRDIALVVFVLAAALAGFALELTWSDSGARLQISVEGEVFGVYDLGRDQTIKIGDGNICRIEDGSAWMEWAACPTSSAYTMRISAAQMRR